MSMALAFQLLPNLEERQVSLGMAERKEEAKLILSQEPP